jgi:bifunctional oligoribonuclease and PAP phosphatase NrnA
VTYRTPETRRAAVREAADVLRASRRAVLTTHLNADGDGAGSEVAIAAWLRANGARAEIINPTRFPDGLRFLLPDASWALDAGSDRAREACAGADLAVVLDTGEVQRIGRVKSMIGHLPTVVIDHHPPGDQPIGGVSLRDPSACATGELVYDLMSITDGPWPEEALRGIYVAILTDTGSFRFANSTPDAHRIVAELIERGVDPEEMYRHVYASVSPRRFKLLEASLASMEIEPGLGWMIVPREVFEAEGATSEDLEGLVDYPRSVAGTEVALLFRHTARGTKVSLRSNGHVDVNALARQFGGGGHVRASGVLVDAPPEKAIPAVLEAAREALREVGIVPAPAVL